MISYKQIFLCLLAAHWPEGISGKPFGELLLKRSSEIGFKPLPLMPFAILKEKWPLGSLFSIRHGKSKRDLDEITSVNTMNSAPIPLVKDVTRLPAAVHEIQHHDIVPSVAPFLSPARVGPKPLPCPTMVPIVPTPEPVLPLPVPVSPMPLPMSPIPVPVRPISVPMSHIPVPVRPITVPMSPIPVPVRPIPVPMSPIPVPMSPIAIPVHHPPPHHGPIPASPVVITPPTIMKEKPLNNALHTDIYSDELIKTYLKSVESEKVLPPIENSISRQKPKNDVHVPIEKEDTNFLRRGSRMAVYFGNILLDVFSQLMGGERRNVQILDIGV